MSDENIVIEFINKVGMSEACRVLGIARPTGYNRLKNPETVTLKELKIVQDIKDLTVVPAEAPPEAPEGPVDDRRYIPRVPANPNPMPAAVEPVKEPDFLPEMRFRPATKKTSGPPGLNIEGLDQRLTAIEEYLRVISTNQNLMAGKPAVGQSVEAARPKAVGEHPLAQLHRAGNPQDAPRPQGLRPEFDSGWNNPRPVNRQN